MFPSIMHIHLGDDTGPQGQDKAAEAGTQAPRHGVELPGAWSKVKGIWVSPCVVMARYNSMFKF